MKTVFLVGCATIFFLLPSAQSQCVEKVQQDFHLNGPRVISAFKSAKKKILPVCVRLFRNNKPIAHAMLVDKRGYILTKASSSVGASFMKDFKGDAFPVRIRKRDEKTDLALLQILGPSINWPSVAWTQEEGRSKEGHWVVCANQDLSSLNLGITGGQERAIGREGGVMGIVFDESKKTMEGILIIEVVPHAAADRAGLQAMDLLLKMDGRKIDSSQEAYELLNSKDPGDLVVLQINRRGSILSLRLTLGHKSVTYDLFNRNLLMSGPISNRKDDFPYVLQHDLPLSKEMIGGGLFDPFGDCVAINIAKVDRVTNYAIPMKVALPIIKNWMSEISDER